MRPSNPAAAVDVLLPAGRLTIWRLADDSWRVVYGDTEQTGRHLVPLLEQLLGGSRNPDVFRYAVRAMEADATSKSVRGTPR